MTTQSEQAKLFEDWQQKQRNEELFKANLKDSRHLTTQILRIITKYDNLFQDVIDGNKQYVSIDCMTSEFYMCIRFICQILDENFA